MSSIAGQVPLSKFDRDVLKRQRSQRLAWGLTFGRVFIGGLFILAGVMKLSDPQKFLEAVQAFRLLPDHLAKLTAFALPWTELLAGILLVVGLWSRAAAWLVSGLLLAFIAGVASVIARGIDASCACFGKIEWPCAGGVGACQIVRNLVMLALILPVALKGPGHLKVSSRT